METINLQEFAQPEPPCASRQLSEQVIRYIVDALERDGETKVLYHPMWSSRTPSDAKDEPVNFNGYLHGAEWPNGLSRYLCENHTYEGEIIDFVLCKKVGFPDWIATSIHILEEEDFKYIFDRLLTIGKQIKEERYGQN